MRTATDHARDCVRAEIARDRALSQVSSLTGEVMELRDRIARRDETIDELVSENERLLREIAEREAEADNTVWTSGVPF